MKFIDVSQEITSPPAPAVETGRRTLIDVVRTLWAREIVRYLVGGGVNTVFTHLVYLLLLLMATWQVANTISYIIGIFTAYFINARYVFRQPLNWRKAVQFPLMYLFQYAITMALSSLLIDGLHIHVAIAPIIVTFITIPITFLATRLLLKPKS
ncbi:MAG: GtrA family protein [Chloroflexota bacterium]|nr:GtrA family protein [Chloroflexota bacterium]